jgi:uncharacterized protein YgiM (DUF1202 family)
VSNDATNTDIRRVTASTIERRARHVPRVALAIVLAVAMIGVFSSALVSQPAAARSGLLFEPGQRVSVNTDLLNLRAGQGTSFEIIDQLPYGTGATILGLPAGGSDDGYDWYQIETDGGQVGWVAGMYLVASGGSDGGTVFIPYASAAIVATDSLNLRADWGLGGTVIDVLPYGTEVVIDSKPYDGDGYTWYAVSVRDSGAYGWVAGNFLEVVSGSGISVGDLISVNTDALNIRDGAGLGWNVIDVLPYGFQASVIDGPVTVDGYTWYKISTSAITGWVAGEYLVAI